MPVPDYSVTASLNTSLGSINIAEGCPAGNVNGAIRQLMADIRVMYDALPNTGNFLPRDGSVHVTGDLIRNSAGGYLYNQAGAPGGIIYLQPLGSPTPAMRDGDWLAEY